MIDKSAVAQTVSYTVNGTTAIFGVLTFEIVVASLGVIVCLATYITTLYFQRRRDTRERQEAERKQEMHALTLRKLMDK